MRNVLTCCGEASADYQWSRRWGVFWHVVERPQLTTSDQKMRNVLTCCGEASADYQWSRRWGMFWHVVERPQLTTSDQKMRSVLTCCGEASADYQWSEDEECSDMLWRGLSWLPVIRRWGVFWHVVERPQLTTSDQKRALRLANDVVNHFSEVGHFMDRCVIFKHEMETTIAPYKDMCKDMHKTKQSSSRLQSPPPPVVQSLWYLSARSFDVIPINPTYIFSCLLIVGLHIIMFWGF